MTFDEFLGEMQKSITASQQGDMFGDKQTLLKTSADACVEFLKEQGYSVRPPLVYPYKITKLDELISLFYLFVKKLYQPHLLPYSNVKRDRAIAKSFVEKRMKDDNVSRAVALNQCAAIVQTVFTHTDIFKFDTPPTFGVLGQAEMGWVTDRAIQIINKKIAKNVETATERAVDKMTEEIEKTYKMGFSLEKLEALRVKLEGQYGKKET